MRVIISNPPNPPRLPLLFPVLLSSPLPCYILSLPYISFPLPCLPLPIFKKKTLPRLVLFPSDPGCHFGLNTLLMLPHLIRPPLLSFTDEAVTLPALFLLSKLKHDSTLDTLLLGLPLPVLCSPSLYRRGMCSKWHPVRSNSGGNTQLSLSCSGIIPLCLFNVPCFLCTLEYT